MKLLHLPYEGGTAETDLDFDSRVALRELLNEGVITELNTFSFKADWLEHSDASITHKKIIDLVKNHRPDVLLWHHITTIPVSDSFFRELRDIAPNMFIAYHEGDAYGYKRKPVTSSMSCMIRNADAIFWVGLGSLRDLAVKHGAKHIYLSPHNFDTDRFWDDWIPTTSRTVDVSMIASNLKSRNPFWFMPGGKKRRECAQLLTQTFGNRFALYGPGWDASESNRGMLPFPDQHKAIRDSWVSVNWDHFDDVNFYASNRLPISMAAGVPHITTYHRGFEYQYREVKGGLYFAKTPSEVVDMACYLLSKPVSELIEEGIKAKEYAYEHLRSTVVFANVIAKIKQLMKYEDKETLIQKKL